MIGRASRFQAASLHFGVGLATTLVAFTSIASGQNFEPAPVSLSWQAAEGCISSDRLSEGVAAMLARPVWAAAGQGYVSLEGTLGAEPGGWVLRLALRDASRVLGTREVHRPGGDCSSLDRTVVVIVSLLVDLPRSDIVLLIAPEPEPVTPTSPPTAGVAPSAPADGAARRLGTEVRLGVDAWLDVGTLPTAAAGGQLSVAIVPARGWPALRLTARALAPSTTALDAEGRGAKVWLAGAAFEICPEARLGDVLLGARGGVAADALVGSGLGLASRDAVGVRWSAHALGTIGLRVGVVDFTLALGVALTLARDSFVRDRGTATQSVLHEPAWVTFEGTLGAAARFGS